MVHKILEEKRLHSHGSARKNEISTDRMLHPLKPPKTGELIVSSPEFGLWSPLPL